MRNRWLLNLALLVVIGALAAALFHTSRSARHPVDTPIGAIAPDAVRRIEIVRRNQPTLVIERSNDGGDGWRLTAPVRARANGFNVDAILRLGNAPSEGRIDAAPDTLARYGLDPPEITVRLDDEAIEFGAMHPLKSQHYVRLRGQVHLVASHHYAQAAGSLNQYVDTRLLEEGRQPVAFELPGFRVALADGAWTRQPPDAALSSDRINAFVDEWRYARALTVTPSTGPAPKKRVTITFAVHEGASQKLVLGIRARQPELILVRPDEGLEYHFPEDAAKRLLSLTADAK